MAVFNTARVRLFATHSHNPVVVYKAFQFAIIFAKFSSYSCLAHSATIAMMSGCYLFIVHMNMHALVLAHTCARACIVAHMDLYIIVMAYSHTHSSTQYTCTYQMGYTCMWHTINLSGTDSTHTHKHCDMQMHSFNLLNFCCAFFYRPLI